MEIMEQAKGLLHHGYDQGEIAESSSSPQTC
jgi:hypothetical protein